MVTGEAHKEAAAAARDNPALDVGLHLVVCRGLSLLDSGRVAGLVDAQGAFASNPVVTGLRYFFDRRLRSQLRDECRAQVEKHLELVGYLNHINGHLNFHAHPVICDIVMDLAAEFRIPCLRLVREPLLTTLRLSRAAAARKVVEAVIFRLLSARMRRLAKARGLKSNDWLFGLHQSGRFTESYLHGLIPRLPQGVTEIYFHPAADVGRTPPPAEAQREVALLTDPRLKELLAANGVKLTTFAEIARQSRN